MKRTLALLYILLITFNGFSSTGKLKGSPASLKESYLLLDKVFSSSELKQIDESTTPEIMNQFHMGLGMSIRNVWIRHGDKALTEEINYKPWKIGIDDLSGVILDGYWHYRHQKEFDWSQQLDFAEKYYLSYDEPSEFPEGITLEKQSSKFVIMNKDYTEMAHIYIENITKKYYLFTHTLGWKIFTQDEFNDFKQSQNKFGILSSE